MGEFTDSKNNINYVAPQDLMVLKQSTEFHISEGQTGSVLSTQGRLQVSHKDLFSRDKF